MRNKHKNPHVGEPTKKTTALKTYKTSLGNTISQLFTNKHLVKFDNLRQCLKSAKRWKNYTAIYKEYYQTETLIQRQIEQELQQAELDIQTWKQEFESEHNRQPTQEELSPAARNWMKHVKLATKVLEHEWKLCMRSKFCESFLYTLYNPSPHVPCF